MPKPDIRAESMLKWDEYKDKTHDLALPSIYARASVDATRFSAWYWTSIRTKRQTSLAVRFLTFLLLILGTLLPILAGLGDKPEHRLELTQIGVVSLALGGLLQVGDRVFGWSSGWIRYISTATAMENLARKFEMDWAGYIIGKNGKLDDSDTKPLFDFALQLQQGLSKLQTDETESWKAEFNTGASILNDMIKAQRESTEKASDAARAAQKAAQDALDKATQSGAVEVSLVHKAAPVAVKIGLDDESLQTFIGTVWSRLKMDPGLHRIIVTLSDAQAPVITKVIEVKPGAVATLEVKLP